MESKHKNALIGALLAVVFVMAVGYAAFAQQLTINGTAEITSKWDIHFDPAFQDSGTSSNQAISVHTGQNGTGVTSSVVPTGSISYDNANLVATLTADLKQPGDSVTYVMHPKNYGSNLNATGLMTVGQYTGSATVTNTGEAWTGTTISNTNATNQAVTVTKGLIKFVITPEFANPLAPNASDTITVVASYEQPSTNDTRTVQTSAGITITLNYKQV